jgi:transposase, IS5 family
MYMIRKRAGQRSFSDAILFGAHIPDPKTLLDPVLRKLDEVLGDDELVDEVLDALRKRHPQSGRRGRPGTPAEVVLRMLALKHIRQWSFEELEWEVTGNVAYRAFCRIDAGKVPDAKTMIRINQTVNEATLRRVFDRIVEQAKKRKVTRGRRMRVDTTVVETGVRYPLDSGLCEDVTRVACREMERVRAAGLPVPDTFRNVRRSVARRLYEIEQINRRPTSREAKLEALKKPYKRLLRIVGRVVRQARVVVEAAKRLRRTIAGRVSRSLRGLECIVTNGKRVVVQTRARILRGETRTDGKLVSIFEPHTRIIRKGKKHKPTEFGRTVKVQEAEGGVVTDIAVVDVHDSALIESSIEVHKKHFGRAPHLLSTDRGFYSTSNVARASEMGVSHVVIPKPGHRSDALRAIEGTRRYRRARAWRAGGEARISRLKRTFGMARSRYRGEAGLARCTYWAAIANNLVAIARAG